MCATTEARSALWELRSATNALTAMERYFDLRAQFNNPDEEGYSGVRMNDVDKAREDAIRALAKLGEHDD